MRVLAAFCLILGLGARVAAAAEDSVRLDLRLMGADLVDEMVYSWLKSPPVAAPASLFVAEIDAPVGIDQHFDEDIENHLFEVLRANPKLSFALVHCSLCRQSVAVSNPKRTVIGRALEMPEGQELLQSYPHLNALSLHFDVVDRELVLWAEVYEVAPPQKVIWSRRFSTLTSARAVLREPNKLISITEAREEQQKLIAGRDTIRTVTRFPVRTFSAANTGAQVQPLIFLEQSVEGVLSPRQNRIAGLGLGLTSIKGSMQGYSLGAYFMQLLGRSEPSLTQPDVFLRVGAVYMRLEGPGSAPFAQNQLDVNKLVNTTDDPRASIMAYQLGLEVRLKYRFGLGAFIEYMPVLDGNQTIVTQKALVPFHALGVSGVFQW